jgi:hypothetical protein
MTLHSQGDSSTTKQAGHIPVFRPTSLHDALHHVLAAHGHACQRARRKHRHMHMHMLPAHTAGARFNIASSPSLPSAQHIIFSFFTATCCCVPTQQIRRK